MADNKDTAITRKKVVDWFSECNRTGTEVRLCLVGEKKVGKSSTFNTTDAALHEPPCQVVNVSLVTDSMAEEAGTTKRVATKYPGFTLQDQEGWKSADPKTIDNNIARSVSDCDAIAWVVSGEQLKHYARVAPGQCGEWGKRVGEARKKAGFQNGMLVVTHAESIPKDDKAFKTCLDELVKGYGVTSGDVFHFENSTPENRILPSSEVQKRLEFVYDGARKGKFNKDNGGCSVM